ncbi:MAG: fluoride efflux transporter CrcB [Natrialbaceae archaeon]|nr:fluoride efflux transporter CrcB [Natrialbaceae archaeon]
MSLFVDLALVGLGGSIGAIARYAVYRRITVGSLPAATFTVNVLGSALLGLVYASGAGSPVSLFLGVGFCGAFTTFSTFAVETVQLLERGDRFIAILNALVTLVTALGVIGLASFLLGSGVRRNATAWGFDTVLPGHHEPRPTHARSVDNS